MILFFFFRSGLRLNGALPPDERSSTVFFFPKPTHVSGSLFSLFLFSLFNCLRSALHGRMVLRPQSTAAALGSFFSSVEREPAYGVAFVSLRSTRARSVPQPALYCSGRHGRSFVPPTATRRRGG